MKKYIDLQLLKYLTLFYTLCVFINMSKKVYWKLNDLTVYAEMSWFGLLTYNIFLDWVIVIAFMILISNLTKRMFEKGYSWKKIIGIHIFFSFFIGYFVFFVAGLIGVIAGDITFGGGFLRNLSLSHFFAVVELNFLIYAAMIGIINVYYYIKKVKSIELQKSQLQTHLANSRLNILKAQLHPHFIFNTLNSISSLIEIDKEKSQNLIADFGDLFRTMLEFKDENLIPLKQELEFLDKYMDIISVRFSDHLSINKDIDKHLEDILVPYMMLQPLVENSVKHGYSYNKTELTIDLSIKREGDYLIVQIKNNGELLNSPYKKLIKQGTGISNTNDRLTTLYDDDFTFSLKNSSNECGVEVFIKIPVRLSTSPEI